MKTLCIILVAIIFSVSARAQKDYDYKAAALAGIKPDARGHMPDTYKLPNHITFSTDSKYSNDLHKGGVWYLKRGTWYYKPSRWVLSQHSAKELKAYFKKYESESILQLF